MGRPNPALQSVVNGAVWTLEDVPALAVAYEREAAGAARVALYVPKIAGVTQLCVSVRKMSMADGAHPGSSGQRGGADRGSKGNSMHRGRGVE